MGFAQNVAHPIVFSQPNRSHSKHEGSYAKHFVIHRPFWKYISPIGLNDRNTAVTLITTKPTNIVGISLDVLLGKTFQSPEHLPSTGDILLRL